MVELEGSYLTNMLPMPSHAKVVVFQTYYAFAFTGSPRLWCASLAMGMHE